MHPRIDCVSRPKGQSLSDVDGATATKGGVAFDPRYLLLRKSVRKGSHVVSGELISPKTEAE